jgi:hypothetical protein
MGSLINQLSLDDIKVQLIAEGHLLTELIE